MSTGPTNNAPDLEAMQSTRLFGELVSIFGIENVVCTSLTRKRKSGGTEDIYFYLVDLNHLEKRYYDATASMEQVVNQLNGGTESDPFKFGKKWQRYRNFVAVDYKEKDNQALITHLESIPDARPLPEHYRKGSSEPGRST